LELPARRAVLPRPRREEAALELHGLVAGDGVIGSRERAAGNRRDDIDLLEEVDVVEHGLKLQHGRGREVGRTRPAAREREEEQHLLVAALSVDGEGRPFLLGLEPLDRYPALSGKGYDPGPSAFLFQVRRAVRRLDSRFQLSTRFRRKGDWIRQDLGCRLRSLRQDDVVEGTARATGDGDERQDSHQAQTDHWNRPECPYFGFVTALYLRWQGLSYPLVSSWNDPAGVRAPAARADPGADAHVRAALGAVPRRHGGDGSVRARARPDGPAHRRGVRARDGDRGPLHRADARRALPRQRPHRAPPSFLRLSLRRPHGRSARFVVPRRGVRAAARRPPPDGELALSRLAPRRGGALLRGAPPRGEGARAERAARAAARRRDRAYARRRRGHRRARRRAAPR